MPKRATVVGAGPAGLMAAQVLAEAGIAVTIIDHKAAPARKFLLAGRGGLNLTHSEPLDGFLKRYGRERDFLEPMIRAFPPDAVVRWATALGIETFVGTSGRIFPKVMKASPLLRNWLRYLAGIGVVLKASTAWAEFTTEPTILALGGASWPETGSNAAWVQTFEASGIRVNPFQASNGRILVSWSTYFAERFAGTPLKAIQLTYAGQLVKGEAMISAKGLEGGAIYQLSRVMRERPGQPLLIDLKPGLSGDVIAKRLAQPKGKLSQSNFLRKALGLPPVAIALLHETHQKPNEHSVKSLAFEVKGFEGLRRSISSAGGVALDEVDAHCQLRKRPMTYCVGEMLDWDAPTGGYLLQACFSTAVAAATDLSRKLA